MNLQQIEVLVVQLQARVKNLMARPPKHGMFETAVHRFEWESISYPLEAQWASEVPLVSAWGEWLFLNQNRQLALKKSDGTSYEVQRQSRTFAFFVGG